MLLKLSSKNAQPKSKHSFNHSRSIPLKKSTSTCAHSFKTFVTSLKLVKTFNFKIKSPRPLNQKNPTSTSLLPYVIPKPRSENYPRIVSTSKLEGIVQSFARDQVIATLGSTTYASTSNLKTESEENCKQRL
ncbi:hypothetical protein ACFX2F_019331 [Malus domestica]